jgi:broad specificity phosphatase PhoE
MLILVRHAMPAYEQSVLPELWPLTVEGREAARALDLPADAYLVASEEVKAWQTLEPFGAAVRDARFNEVRRSGEPWDGNFRELRRAYVDGADHEDWERRASVVARFDAGIEDHTVRGRGRPVVVATHGMAMTLWLAAKISLPDPARFWESLRFPDAYCLNPAGTLAPLSANQILDF